MTRKERKEKADKRRLEISQSLLSYMEMTAKGFSNEDIKWQHVMKAGDVWVQQHVKLYPQEAHMYKAAAVMVKNWILEVSKKGNKNE